MKKLFALVCLLCCLQATRATHIIGGELYYDCLGGNTYRITLKVYRDCFLGQAPYDDPAKITVWSGVGGYMQVIEIPFPGSTNVPFISSNPCFQAPANVCVEQAIYQTTVTLPNSPSGYIFAYQRCCRNNTIVNLVDPGNTGATYTERVPASDLCNNSPRFTNFPPIALCIGEPLVFDHSAIDPDGDSLVYQLCSTYEGASPTDPEPYSTSTPPFSNITFQPPYSSGYPIASTPAAAIDPITGILTVKPTQLGQYVVGVCVSEYRNGVLIGTHSRDFQFNVTNCLSNVQSVNELPASFVQVGNVYESCDGLTVPFENNSVNASYYYWDFGVPVITSDTSVAFQPSFTYPNSGTYTIMLVANPGYFCADTDYVTIHIREEMDIDFNAPPGQCIDLNSYDFIANGIIPAGTLFNWNFGPSAVPTTSNTQNTLGVNFTNDGIYTVTLAADYDGCLDTAIHDIIVYGHPTVTIDVDTTGCVNYDAHFTATVDTAYNDLLYNWTFGDGNTSNLEDPVNIYYTANTFSVTFQLVSLTGCKDTIIINKPNWITVYPVPTAGFTVEPTEQSIFFPHFYITQNPSPDVVDCWMDYDDGNLINACNNGWYTYLDTGHYNVTQYVYNNFGCPDTAIVPIVVRPEFVFNIPNTFTPNFDDLNEGFRGKGIGIKEYDFRIYDRWGRTLFKTNDQLEEWNGCLNNHGIILPEDIYVYSVDIVDVFNEKHHYAGKVLLIKSVFPK
jgi:gliding motility-associated-like protein